MLTAEASFVCKRTVPQSQSPEDGAKRHQRSYSGTESRLRFRFDIWLVQRVRANQLFCKNVLNSQSASLIYLKQSTWTGLCVGRSFDVGFSLVQVLGWRERQRLIRYRSGMNYAWYSMQGTVHQAFESFNELSRGRQCVVQSKCSSSRVHTQSIVDRILQHGDSMYLHALSNK